MQTMSKANPGSILILHLPHLPRFDVRNANLVKSQQEQKVSAWGRQ